eukprot:3027198-Lingulodinium_polyedra.AAC.1
MGSQRSGATRVVALHHGSSNHEAHSRRSGTAEHRLHPLTRARVGSATAHLLTQAKPPGESLPRRVPYGGLPAFNSHGLRQL